MQILFVYATASNAAEAQKISRFLLEKKLVACVNIIPQIQSLYWWDGKIQESTEVAMVMKTSSDRLRELVNAFQKSHSYDVPALVAMPVAGGVEPFLQWVGQQTGAL